MKKIFAVLLTLAMVLGMTATVFAEGRTPSSSDSKKVTINNVESDATLDAYQIVAADYDGGKFTGRYNWLIDFTVGEKTIAAGNRVNNLETLDGLTAEVLTSLNTNGLTHKDAKTEELNVGTWMVIAASSSDAGKVYNPMLVSVYYTTDGTVATQPLDASKNWSLGSTTAYAKASDGADVDKKVIDKTTGTQKQNYTSEVDETVTFELTGTIPSYGPQYQSPSYKLTDTILNGLEYNSDVTVKVNGQNAQAGNYTLTYYGADGTALTGTDATARAAAKSFSVSFTSTYITSLVNTNTASRAVSIVYDAKVTDAAKTTDAHNKVKVEYTRTTDSSDDSGEKDKDVYVYTVAIDGVLQKVDGDGDALDGATFTLYDNSNLADAAIVDTWTTGEESHTEGTQTGSIHFQGLDATKTYYLKETASPTGYSLNETVYTITFDDVQLDADGKLSSYKVKVSYPGANGATVNKDATINVGTPLNTPADTIVNTTLASLPSTGGIGTTIFTIGGCAIMIIAAGLYFATRRRTAK